MRRKARGGLRTFALTADVDGAHRQIPFAKCDWNLLGCPVHPGEVVLINTVRRLVSPQPLSSGRIRSWTLIPTSRRRSSTDMAYA